VSRLLAHVLGETPRHRRLGFSQSQRRDVRAVPRQVRAGAGADFQYAASCGFEQPSASLAQPGFFYAGKKPVVHRREQPAAEAHAVTSCAIYPP
jgi:hypothetical protein